MTCHWCSYNPYAPACDNDGQCSLKAIPESEDAVAKKLREEVAYVSKYLDKLVRAPNNVIAQDVFDRSHGVGILRDILKKKYGWSKKQLNESKIRLSPVKMMKLTRAINKLSKGEKKKWN